MTDMTPVTDDDRKAHQFSDNVLANPGDFGPDSVATARAVKAHVPAPPAPLADELRTRAHACIGPDGNPIFGGDETLLVLADRVEAVERELNSERRNTQHLSDLLMRESDSSTKLSAALDEARAEVEQWQSNTGQANLDLAKAQRERDDAREKLADKLDEVAQLHTEVERLSRDREDQERALVEHGRLLSEARAEVEQLKDDLNTAADEVNRRTDEHTWPRVTPSGHTYNEPTTYEELCLMGGNVAQAAVEQWDDSECPPEPTWEMVGLATAEVERLTRDRTSKESLPVALPDPADVPEGELWMIRAHGWNGLRVGARNDADQRPATPWHWMFAEQHGHGQCGDNHVELVSRLVLDVRRVIDTAEGLDALPVRSIVLDDDGDPWKKKTNGEWEGLLMTLDSEDMIDCHNSVTVIHEPTVDSSTGSSPDCPEQG